MIKLRLWQAISVGHDADILADSFHSFALAGTRCLELG